MNASSTTFRMLVGMIIAGAALAALAAPAAWSSSLRGYVSVAHPSHHSQLLPQASVSSFHEPEIVSGLTASPEGRAAPRPEVIAGIASPGYQVLVSSPAQLPTSGFDWADAGIGAAVALAGVALASGGALAVRKRVSLAH